MVHGSCLTNKYTFAILLNRAKEILDNFFPCLQCLCDVCVFDKPESFVKSGKALDVVNPENIFVEDLCMKFAKHAMQHRKIVPDKRNFFSADKEQMTFDMDFLEFGIGACI